MIDKPIAQIVSVEEHDLNQLQKLSVDTFYDAFAHMNTEEDMKLYEEKAFNKSQLLMEIRDTNARFYFIKLQEKTVGYCKIKFGLPTEVSAQGKAVEVCRLYVHRDYQGQKLGQMMLDHILQIANEYKLDFVWLGVWSQNPGAIRLYERNGFTKIGSYTFMLGTDPQTDHIMKRPV